MRLIRAIGVSTWEGVAFMAAFTSSSAMSITVSRPYSPTSARISMMVRLNAAHQSFRSAERRRVNGWDARVGHQELLREGQLVADAL
eukprot:2523086-Pleurochrysis_carterae.AAC.1